MRTLKLLICISILMTTSAFAKKTIISVEDEQARDQATRKTTHEALKNPRQTSVPGSFGEVKDVEESSSIQKMEEAEDNLPGRRKGRD